MEAEEPSTRRSTAPLDAGSAPTPLVYFLLTQTSRGASFQLRLDDDTRCLEGTATADRARCVSMIREVITRLREPGALAVEPAARGQFELVLKDSNDATLARGAPTSRASASALRARALASARDRDRFEVRADQPRQRRATPRAAAPRRYDRAQRSVSGRPGVERLQRDGDRLHCVHVNDAQGVALVFSPGFRSRHDRDRRAAALTRAAATEAAYRRSSDPEGAWFTVVSRNHRELGVSRVFSSPEARDAAIEWLIATASTRREGLTVERDARPVAAAGFDRARPSTRGPPGLERLRDERGAFRFRYNDERGRPVLFSHGYRTARARERGVAALVRTGLRPELVRVAPTGDPRSFEVRAANGRALARSRVFQTSAALERAVAWLRAALPIKRHVLEVITCERAEPTRTRARAATPGDSIPPVAAAASANAARSIKRMAIVVRLKLHTPAGTSANELVRFFSAHGLTTSEARIVADDENAIEWRVTVNEARAGLAESASERGWTLHEPRATERESWASLTTAETLNLDALEASSADDGARQWSQLEGWLMKGYTAKLKALAMQVARMELSLARFDRALESRLGAAFSAWSQHFDERLGAQVQAKIASLISNELSGAVAQQTVELRKQISQGLLADIDAKLTALVDGRVRALRNELRSSLDREIEQSVELQLVRLRARLVADLSVDLEKLVEINLSKALANARVDVDVETVRAELTATLNRVAVVENRLSTTMERRVDALQQWTADQLIGLKGCMTDREVLVDILSATVSRLRTELGRSPCVNPSSWTSRAATPGDAAGAGQTSEQTAGATDDAPAHEDEPGRSIPAGARADGEAVADADELPPETAPDPTTPSITQEDLERLQSWASAPAHDHAREFASAFSLFSATDD